MADLNTKQRRKAVDEILHDAPVMVSRRALSMHLTKRMRDDHGFEYPNRVMRKTDIDTWANALPVPDRKGVSLTLLAKALDVADKAAADLQFSASVRALEFARSITGADLSALETPGESVYDAMAAGIEGLFAEISKRDTLDSINDEESTNGEIG